MKLYTIVLTHYNQMEYIEEALDSVFIQNYPNIELLITDDASKNFDENKVTEYIKKHNPKSVKVCTLLSKPSRRIVELNIDYIGFSIPDEFVIGFGMDYDQKYRNLPYIAKMN